MMKRFCRFIVSLIGKERAKGIAEYIYHAISGQWIEDLEEHSEELDRYRNKYGWM